MRYTLLFLIILIAMPALAIAEKSESLYDTIIFSHVAMNGSTLTYPRDNQEFHELEGMEMPIYIGYYIVITDPGWREIKYLKFVRTSNLKAVDFIEERFRWVEDAGGLSPDDREFITINHPEFWRFFIEEIGRRGVEDFYLESYLHFFPEPYPTEPKFTASDFEFENICICRPFDDPPEYCDKLEIKLKNDPKAAESK